MSFETPAALWGLASLLLLAIFSLWRQAAARVVVPSVLLWKKIPERNPPVRELKRPAWRLDLLFQAAALALVVGALAGPYREGERPQPRRIVFVVDTSPGMAAGGRLDRLLEDSRRLAEGPLGADEVAWLSAAGRTEDPSSLRAGPRAVDLAPLLAAARAGADEVVVLTSKPVEGARSWCRQGPAGNAGIADLRAHDDLVFVRFVNFGTARPADLILEGGTAPVRERVTLAEGVSTWSRKGEFTKSGRLKATLDLEDGWAGDNTAEAVREGSRRLKVALSGRAHPALLRVLEALPGAEVARGMPGAALSAGLDEDPVPATVRVRMYTPSARLPGAVKVHEHALTQGLAGREEELAAAGLGELPAEARAGAAPIWTVEGRVAGAVRGGEVHLAVDLDGWSRGAASFPIFWANAAERAAGGGFRSVGVLDEAQSDTRGLDLPLEAGALAPAGRARRRTPLGGWAAGLALLCMGAAWGIQRRG